MDRRTKITLAMALWIGPVVLGTVIALWIVAPARPGKTKNGHLGEAARDDRDRLQGIWIGVLVERDGRVVHRDADARTARVRFVGSVAVFEDTDTTLVGNFQLGPSRTPKTFDLTVDEGGAEETYPAGIYELNDDSFRLCFAFPAAVRPSEFATYPGSGRTLFVYRRLGSGARAERQLPDDPRMKGDHIISYFDGKKSLAVDDSTFPDAGKIGLWSKSDARSYFDDLTVSSTE
jgi:uncharacterized protein (TIGR03067 family)